MILMDCHTHTGFSPDGTGTVAQLCDRAEALGISALAMTEHVEMNRFYSQAHYGTEPRNPWEVFSHDKVLADSLAAVSAEKSQRKSFRLLCGMEMGQPNADFSLSEQACSDQRLDFVIASLHELLGEEDFFCLDYTRRHVPELLTLYFQQLYDICRWGCFDVLGHLTYPLRYMVGEAGISVDLQPYTEQICCCFRTLVENGKGIELNTSGLRQKYGKTFPDLPLLRLYREMGGEILTLGSDAHCAEDLGKGIAAGMTLAQEAGFGYVCYFEKRKPVFVRL